jgi:hypothetical protein
MSVVELLCYITEYEQPGLPPSLSDYKSPAETLINLHTACYTLSHGVLHTLRLIAFSLDTATYTPQYVYWARALFTVTRFKEITGQF